MDDEVTAEGEAAHGADEHSPGGAPGSEGEQEGGGGEVDADIDSRSEEGVVGEGVGEKGAEKVQEGEWFQESTGTTEVKAAGAFGQERQGEKKKAVEGDGKFAEAFGVPKWRLG